MIVIPESVAKFLASSVKRVRKIYYLRGVAAAGAIFLASLVAAMITDAKYVIFSDGIRYAMSGAIYALTALTAFIALYFKLRRPLSPRRIAETLDKRHPEHEECLSTLVEIADRSRDGRTNYSSFLVNTLSTRCEVAVEKLDVEKEFTLRTVMFRLEILCTLAALLILSLVCLPNLAGRLFVRAAMPWIDVGNLFENDLSVKPGNIVALNGSILKIEVTADESLHSTPMIRISRRTGSIWGEEFAEELKDSVYMTTADISEPEWRYRVSCGPAVSKYYTVRVCELPRYRCFTARLEYPKYTGRKATVYPNESVGALRAIAGTKVVFDVEPEQAGTVAGLMMSGGAGINLTSDTGHLEGLMISNRVGVWAMELMNADGFKAPKKSGTLTSVLDGAPSIAIEKPQGVLKLATHAKFPIYYTATDDVALGTKCVRSRIDGGEWRDVTLPDEFDGTGATLHRGVEEIDLSWFDLDFARKIEFDFVLTDNYPVELGGPHAVTSGVVTVEFKADALSFEEQTLAEQMKNSLEMMHEAEQRFDAAKREAEAAKNQLERDRGKVSENAEKEIEKLAHDIDEAEKRARELAEDLHEDGKFEPIAEALEEFADETMEPIREKLEEAQFAEAEERREALKEVQPLISEVKKQMQEVEKEIKARGEKLAAYERTKDLAERQEQLAKAAKAMAEERPLDAKKQEAWKRMEESAAKQAGELMKKTDAPQVGDAKRKMEDAARQMDKDAPAAEKEAQEAAEELKSAATAAAEELGLEEEKTEEEEKEDSKENSGGGKAKKKMKNDEKKLSVEGGGTVKEELEKLAEELKRNDISESEKVKLSKQMWMKIRGGVKNGLGERDLKNIPPEYRELVRDYFLYLSQPD